MCGTDKWDTKSLRRLRGTCVHQCSGMDCRERQRYTFAGIKVCPAAGSRLGTISFEGNCFSTSTEEIAAAAKTHSVVETVLVPLSSGHSSSFSHPELLV